MQTVVEISRSALEHNVRQIRGQLGASTKLSLVLKSNAYGHGTEEVLRVVGPLTDAIAVVDGLEALEVRALGYTGRLVILSILDETLLSELLRAGVELPIVDADMAQAVQEVSVANDVVARVHLKLDTGATRIGVLPSEFAELVEMVRGLDRLEVVAVFSHFADSEDPACAYTDAQIESFSSALADVNLSDVERHMACSAAILVAPHAHLDMVRLGLSLYGMWPSEEVRRFVQQKDSTFELKPVLTWKTRVLQVRSIPKGTSVGYGRSYVTRRDTKLVVLPVGYWDGYDRGLSNAAEVLIGGARCPVLGRVCMNLTMVDVTDAPPVVRGDEVVLLGSQGSEYVSAELLAQHAGTINYEVTTRINPLLPRYLV